MIVNLLIIIQGYNVNYNVYIDESGNTGNIEMQVDFTWNYEEQTHFALGAIYMPEDMVENTGAEMQNILHKYDKSLGIEHELKSKAKYMFKIDLLKDITEVLQDKKARFFCDISNKKYKVIISLVDYCIYPYYMNVRSRSLCIEMADFLYRALPLEQIRAFMLLCQRSCDDEQSVVELVDYMERLNEFLILNQKYSIRKVINVVKNYNNYGLKIQNLFPIKDFNNKGVEESFLPNVDAFTNLIASIYKLRLHKDAYINIYHDEQRQFSNVLMKWAKSLEDNGIQIRDIGFPVSKDEIFIQIADFYTGSIVRLYKKIIGQTHIDEDDKKMIKILKPLLCNCNVVAPRDEMQKFFETCGLKVIRSQLPF